MSFIFVLMILIYIRLGTIANNLYDIKIELKDLNRKIL